MLILKTELKSFINQKHCAYRSLELPLPDDIRLKSTP